MTETIDQAAATANYATVWRKLEEERAARALDREVYDTRVKELLEENERVRQRARDAEEQAVRWFNMSKELLAVAGEFAKLMAKP